MAGIYLHVPFCKRRCAYCDFCSTTREEERERYVRALCAELEARRDELAGEEVETVYFGGGTPTRLGRADFEAVFSALYKAYPVRAGAEITLEANPDDLSADRVADLRRLPFNRLSMGVQTFDDDALRLLRRRHTAGEAEAAFRRCREAGFGNLSLDLMYGLPGERLARWEADLRRALALAPEHLSAYCLSYEEGTPLWEMRRAGRVDEADDEECAAEFRLLADLAASAGYEHYELSNFCRPGFRSRHNWAYWTEGRYLGAGPSAHSFDGLRRRWNPSSLDEYLDRVARRGRAWEEEEPGPWTRYNDFVMTRLRTREGLPLDRLRALFGPGLEAYCLRMAAPHLRAGRMERDGGRLRLARRALFVSDGVVADLMRV